MIQGWVIAYFAVILLFESGVTNLLIKSFKSSENWLGIFIMPSYIIYYISSYLKSSQGVSPQHNSYANTPSDHISVLLS